MAHRELSVDVTVAASQFTAAVHELQRLLIGFGRAARRSTWSIRQYNGKPLPTPQQARVDRRSERRRRLRMLREQQRIVSKRRRFERRVAAYQAATGDLTPALPLNARLHAGPTGG